MSDYKHIMLDLETMGVANDSVIASIGAVKFNPEDEDTVDSLNEDPSRLFYQVIDITDALNRGLTITGSTLYFWLGEGGKTTEVARAALFTKDRFPMPEVLDSFRKFVMGPKRNMNMQLWGNGADFDNVLLGNAYDVVGLQAPWKYSNNRCFRTIKNVLPYSERPELVRVGVYHNALDDAKTQVLYLQQCFKKLKGGV